MVGLASPEPVGCRDRGGVPCPKRGEAWHGKKLAEVWASVGAGSTCSGRGLRGVWLLWRWCSARRCCTRSSS